MQSFKPSYKKIFRLVWLVQGIIVVGMVALNFLVFWALNMNWMIVPGIIAILAVSIIGSLIITPLLANLQTIEMDEEKIVTLGAMKPMFTMRWDEVEEVRAGNLMGIEAVSMHNKQSGRQVGFYMLMDDKKAFGHALKEHAPNGSPLQRYAELCLK